MSSPSSEAEELGSLMTPQVAAVLTYIGLNTHQGLVTLVSELMVYAIYFILVLIATYTIIKRPEKTYTTFWLLVALFVTFGLTTTSVFYDLAAIFRQISTLLISNTTLNLEARIGEYVEWQAASRLSMVKLWIAAAGDTGLIFIINDALAAWRATAIRGPADRVGRVLISLLWFLVFLSAAFWVSYISWSMHILAGNVPPPSVGNTDITAILIIVCSSASISANLLATGLIGQTSWKYLYRGYSGVRSRGTKALLYLTESGLFYVLIQIVRFALDLSILPSTPIFGSLSTANGAFRAVSSVITAMYPPALILILHYGVSISDTIQYSSGVQAKGGGGGRQSLSEIQFGPARSTGFGARSTGFEVAGFEGVHVAPGLESDESTDVPEGDSSVSSNTQRKGVGAGGTASWEKGGGEKPQFTEVG